MIKYCITVTLLYGTYKNEKYCYFNKIFGHKLYSHVHCTCTIKHGFFPDKLSIRLSGTLCTIKHGFFYLGTCTGISHITHTDLASNLLNVNINKF